jgi:hypothetical protein
MRTVSIIIIFLIRAYGEAYAQDQDTVWVQGKSILILGDSSVFIARDTVFVLPDSVAFFLKNDTVKRSSGFYRKIKKALYKTSLTTELYHLLFDEHQSKPGKKSSKPDNYATFPEHAGKIIREVKIAKLAVFGTDIDDTTEFKNDSWLIRRGNEIHNYTRSSVIRNHLFFSEGQLLDPLKLEDSERTLRSLPYVKDARVLIEPIDDDAVNVVVLVKDNWSLYPEIHVLNIDRWRLKVTEKNFLGFGHEFFNELRYNSRNTREFGYRGLYRVRNIGHSFITADFTFAESEEYLNRGVRIYRNYVVPEIELAGGMEISLNGHNVVRILPDTIVDFDVKYQYQDVWASHAYPVGSVEKRKRLVTGGRFIRYSFLDQPEVRSDSNYNYFDREQYLLNIGFSKRTYEKSSLIYGFGRTEDIPLGYLLSFSAGKEYNQFYDRWYAQFDYSIGGYLGKIGYFRPSLSLGGFLKNKNIEQGIFKGQLSYFSYLYYLKRFAFRQFFYLNYTHGFNRFGTEFIDINNANGIRGFRSIELLGTKKMIFRSETLSFTPFYLIGFRMAIFGFVDIAAIQQEDGKLWDAKFYQGYGLGIRFRNENLAFKSISIRLGYYPNAPADADLYNMQFGGETILRYQDFAVSPPSVIDFR